MMNVDQIPPELRECKQWVLWKYDTRDGSETKVPYSPKGGKAKSNDPLTWSTFDDAIAAIDGYKGVGFMFSAADPFCGIDLDACRDPASGELSEWAKEWLGRFASYTEVSPSGTGVKVFVRGSNPMGSGKNKKLGAATESQKAPGVEIYDSKRYFAVTGQRLDEYPATCEPRQDVIAEFCQHYWPEQNVPKAARPLSPSIHLTHTADAVIEARAIQYLEEMPEGIDGHGGSNATFDAACRLVNDYALSTDRAFFLLWHYFNPRCVPPWNEKDLRHKVDDAAKQSHTRPRGCLLANHNENLPQADLSRFGILGEHSAEQPELESGPDDPGPLPTRLLNPPGFLSLVIQHTLEVSHRPQPVLALAGSLCLLATLIGRKVRDKTGTRTNLYAIGVCEAAGGKESPREVNNQILFDAGLDHLIGPEEIASATGLTNAIANSKAFTLLMQLDELGKLMRTLGDTHNPYLYGIVATLLKMFTKSRGIYTGSAYADTKKNVRIVQPHLNIFGTSTPDDFYESLTTGNVSDGLLARVLIFEGATVTLRDAEELPVPQAILDEARFWGDYSPGGNLAGTTPQPTVLPYTADAHNLITEFVRYSDSERRRLGEPYGLLWPRAIEKARKLALLYSCSDHRVDGPVDVPAAEWAIEVVSHLTQRLVFLATRWVSSSTYDGKAQKLLRLIESAGQDGIRRTELGRKSGMPPRDRAEILGDLVETGRVFAHEQESTGGRRPLRYISAKFASQRL